MEKMHPHPGTNAQRVGALCGRRRGRGNRDGQSEDQPSQKTGRPEMRPSGFSRPGAVHWRPGSSGEELR